MKKRIRIQGLIIFLAVVVTISLSKFVFPHSKAKPSDEFLDVLGISLVLFGFLFRITARGYKEESSCAGKKLVKDGPYLLMRHPMYFGTLLIGTGIIFVIFELWTLILFLGIFMFIYMPQIKKEEKLLSERFGEEYNNYCKLVPPYFPRLDVDFKDSLSLKISWVKKELVSLITVIVAILVVEVWEDIKWGGNKEFSKEFLELFLIIFSFSIIIILFRKKK